MFKHDIKTFVSELLELRLCIIKNTSNQTFAKQYGILFLLYQSYLQFYIVFVHAELHRSVTRFQQQTFQLEFSTVFNVRLIQP